MKDQQFLYLTTTGWRTGKEHIIEIWYVKNNGKYYVMSELGRTAHWVRNISHDPKISFRINR
ncbi:MAG: nitroreductase/quinone reductase family protein, partial [Nitrososphaeraceae archaeon]|nr:nitroreductase/quinone reductase family protein [Nitrososphaeraceae archaeon]